jgi:nuclear transport factor 2 (NTF2) superfamily protein
VGLYGQPDLRTIQYERWHDASFAPHGNEQWEFADNGLMQRRGNGINDLPSAQPSGSIFHVSRASST